MCVFLFILLNGVRHLCKDASVCLSWLQFSSSCNNQSNPVASSYQLQGDVGKLHVMPREMCADPILVFGEPRKVKCDADNI